MSGQKRSSSQDRARIFGAAGPSLFTAPPERSFLHDLAIGVRAGVKELGLTLSQATVFLPTRRAIRALSEAFVETEANGAASLLPRIRALGDLEEDEIGDWRGGGEDEIDFPPAIAPAERRFILARLIAASRKTYYDGQSSWAGALLGADALGRLLDAFYTEEVDPQDLCALAPETLAAHWRLSLDFLDIILSAWPAILKERGAMDPAARRIALIERQRLRYENEAPQEPIFIAGTTGSTPAVARLIKTVLALPHGAVLLPGLDLDCTDAVWDRIDAPHPQAGLKHLLNAIHLKRKDVGAWPGSNSDMHAGGNLLRREIINVALRPAEISDSWRDWIQGAALRDDEIKDALGGFALVEAADEEREAETIALKLRATIAAPGKTAMLVTPDRDLARRVSHKLRRWRIHIDDSAGVPFGNTPCGVFLRLIARVIPAFDDAACIMALIRHPLFAGGLPDADLNKAADALDRALRGLAPAGGGEALRVRIKTARNSEKASAVVDALAEAAALWPSASVSLCEALAAHLQIADRLSAGPDRPAGALWRGDDGEKGAAALSSLLPFADNIDQLDAHSYAELFDALIADIAVRRKSPGHPRIAIMGPLEARLQHRDCMILGGLNEGVWPKESALDPFLSRAMRAAAGLSDPQQRLGLAAHDFAQLSSAEDVLLTRAKRAAGKPTTPSRWIVRLKNILDGAGRLAQINQSKPYEELASMLDAPRKQDAIAAPAPRPPADARPTSFFVTRVEKLLRDPYSIYARDILKLRVLDPYNEEFSARHLGNLVHRIFFDYALSTKSKDHQPDIEALQALFDRHAEAYGVSPARKAMLAPRLKSAFEWFAQWHHQRGAYGTPIALEDAGEASLKIDAKTFTLSAKADRIDQLSDGTLAIFDYKTGTPPPTKAQMQKFSPQLPLTAMIAAQGGFTPQGGRAVSEIAYLRALGRQSNGQNDVIETGEDCARLIAEAEAGFIALMRRFADPKTPYLSQPRPEYMDDYGDYDRLARRRERLLFGTDE